MLMIPLTDHDRDAFAGASDNARANAHEIIFVRNGFDLSASLIQDGGRLELYAYDEDADIMYGYSAFFSVEHADRVVRMLDQKIMLSELLALGFNRIEN